ncbi:MAG: hypothetical protein ACR2HJ_12690 [Fimbriimonadales bacterium]
MILKASMRPFLIGAFATVIPLALARFSLPLPAPTELAPASPTAYWLKDVAGSRISMPVTDSRGLHIPKARTYLLVLLTCNECSSRSPEPTEFLVRGTDVPVILSFSEQIDEVPPKLRESQDVFLVAGKDSEFLPVEWRWSAPQAFVVRHGKITETPGDHESLDAFIQRIRLAIGGHHATE